MAFTPKVFAKPSLMEWAGHKITDHNRSELDVAIERIEEPTRMANGTMRKYIVADKKTLSVSWDDLPHSADFTVDGFWGKNEMAAWYTSTPGEFDLTLHYGDGTTEVINVFMSKFDASISKRGAYDFWKVQVELTEV